MSKKIALYLVSGFLGAGKTTLVKRLLEQSPNLKVGIIMNEFGRVSIDGPILKKDSLEMIELTRGSIFCSCLKLSFAEALMEMALKELDVVVVESSGLADPSNIGEILEGVSLQMANPYQYSGSITVVDASQFMTALETLETVVKQIECADMTLVNKADLVSQAELGAIVEKVKVLNPETDICVTQYFKELPELLGQDLAKGRYPELRASLNTPENKPKTMSLQFNEPVVREHLKAFIDEVMASAFRVKGFVQTEAEWLEVHGVGQCVDFYPWDKAAERSALMADETASQNPEGSAITPSTLVIISKIGPEIIRKVDTAWKAHCGIPMKMTNG